jgi:hypothetical protein
MPQTTETTEITFKPEADHREDTQMAEAPAPRPEASGQLPPKQIPIPGLTPASPLPSEADLARWLQGEDVPTLAGLLARLEFSPAAPETSAQRRAPAGHRRGLPDDLKFHRLPEVGDLRVFYKNQEVARRRTEALLFGWRELGGKRPAEWTVDDLLQVVRRGGRQMDPVDLLAAARDVWRGLDPQSPQGEGPERIEALGRALARLRADAGAV